MGYFADPLVKDKSVKDKSVVILGGGISGLGVALAAARRGFDTTLLEADKCCRKTSANTLRIIHGGFRYLQQLNIPRVFRSLRNQRSILLEMPEQVRPFPCLMPLNQWGLKSALPVQAGALLYRGIATLCDSFLPAPSVLRRETIERQVPLLRGRVNHGALCWYDALVVEPEQVIQFLLEHLVEQNVAINEGCKAYRVVREKDQFVVETSQGEVRASYVVNALGPWIRSIEPPEKGSELQPAWYKGAWCKGFNLVLSRQLEARYGVALGSDQERLFFAVPRDDRTVIGTWYTPVSSVNAPAEVSEEEVHRFINAFARLVPEFEISLGDVCGFDVGYLPMERDSEKGPVLYGDERVVQSKGYVEILSTKYTTFRTQGEKVMEIIGS